MFRKVLIPNRGEIAVRIIRAAHELGIKTVVTLQEAEKESLPAKLSDEVYYFEEGPLSDNYLNIERIIQVAKLYNADCLHPGYGFLSENYELVNACTRNGIIFIGPSAENLRLMGDKQMARSIARDANVSLTQSINGNVEDILAASDSLSYPVLAKAAMGGGGKGMAICNNKDELYEQLPIIANQSQRYFGDDRVYVEQFITHARHIEVQVLADHHGNLIHLYDRECSVQRRFQKIIEEAPACNLPEHVKERIYEDALSLCKKIGYTNAGTVEFIVDEHGQHYFLEMNTRIQVEHCVTEEITGIDLVQWQFKIANDQVLNIHQEEVKANGHAIEMRICAEDVNNNFRPSPGLIKQLIYPESSDVRIETGIEKPTTILPQFDPMIAKLIVKAPDRDQAIKKAIEANNQLIITGIESNNLFINMVLQHKGFKNNKIHTRFCEEHIEELTSNAIDHSLASLAYSLLRFYRVKDRFWRQLPKLSFSMDGNKLQAELISTENPYKILINNELRQASDVKISSHSISFISDEEQRKFYFFESYNTCELIYNQQKCDVIADDLLPPYKPSEREQINKDVQLKAPLPSQIMSVNVKTGQPVKKGDLLLVLEAMKTENRLKAWKDGIIENVHIQKGEQVKLNQLLISYQDEVN